MITLSFCHHHHHLGRQGLAGEIVGPGYSQVGTFLGVFNSQFAPTALSSNWILLLNLASVQEVHFGRAYLSLGITRSLLPKSGRVIHFSLFIDRWR